MSISTNSTAAFIRGGATQKNLQWLQAVAVNGFDALDVAIELASYADDRLFTLTSFAREIGLDEKAVIAALWSLKESGHIDLQIDGPQFSARRLLNGGRPWAQKYQATNRQTVRISNGKNRSLHCSH